MSQLETQTPSKFVIITPAILRALCGGLSALSSCAITVLFSLTIYQSVIVSSLGYPTWTQMLIMIIAPLISSLQFVNVAKTLAAIFGEITKTPEGQANLGNTVAAENVDISINAGTTIEQQIFGSTSVLIRAFAGLVCCIVINFASVSFAYVIHVATMAGKPLPDDLQMLVPIIGPILMSWSFMQAESTIRNVLGIEGLITSIRTKLADLLTPKQ